MEGKKEFKNCLFLSFDLDLTGSKLHEEMTNIGVYGANLSFKQYVIPHRNVNLYAQKRYLLKTINIYDFRVLRDLSTGKIVKTKTEIFALNDLLSFLEAQNTKNNGVCLMCFESSKLVPFILIEALQRYKLMDRFKKTVRGFVDSFGFVKEKCASSIPKFSLKTLVKILLNRDNERFHDAHERTRLVYEIVSHLSEGESQNKSQDLALGVLPFVTSVENVELELIGMKEFLQKLKSVTPIFIDQFKVANLRVRAVQLRKLLTSNDITYSSLQAVHQVKEDLKEFVKTKLNEGVPDKDVNELVNVISAHFQKSLTLKPKSEKTPKNRHTHTAQLATQGTNAQQLVHTSKSQKQ